MPNPSIERTPNSQLRCLSIAAHVIRDEADFRAHMDCVHINPVKHGLVRWVVDWPYSTFHHCVRHGIYPLDWAGDVVVDSLIHPD